MKKYNLYTDGSYQEKLGIASIGGYIIDSETKEKIFKFSEHLLDENQFKYHESIAMLHGIKMALNHGIKELECFSDDKSIADAFNKNKFNSIEVENIFNHPYKIKIASLIDEFSSIKFNYLPRNLNKEADKLAGKSLRIHKEDKKVWKKRNQILIEQENLLNIPNLICEEDYQEKNTNLHDFKERRKNLINHYLVDIKRSNNLIGNENLTVTYFLIERNPKDHKKIISHVINTQSFENSNIFIKIIKGLTDVFQNSLNQGEIGLMFNGGNSFRTIEMVLRKRASLKNDNKEIIEDFVKSTNMFTKIYLHNDEKIIKNHQISLEKSLGLNKIISI